MNFLNGHLRLLVYLKYVSGDVVSKAASLKEDTHAMPDLLWWVSQ